MAEKFSKSLSASSSLAQRSAGFTFIELLVTIAIGTILMVIAVPSFVAFQRNAQLSDAVSNFISAVNVARANAMKQGIDSYLVPNTGVDWKTGWNVYADTNWNQAYDAPGDPVVLGFGALASSVSVGTATGSIADGYVRFNGSGSPRLKNNGFGGGTLVMSNGTRSSSIIIDPVGRVRSCITGSTGC